jgi:hypothetical protein
MAQGRGGCVSGLLVPCGPFGLAPDAPSKRKPAPTANRGMRSAAAAISRRVMCRLVCRLYSKLPATNGGLDDENDTHQRRRKRPSLLSVRRFAWNRCAVS